MASFSLAVATALWLGLLTAISPCPLATNIAAVSFIGKRVGKSSQVLTAGLLYTFGRTLSYVLVALILVKSLLTMSTVSMFLQRNLILFIGPLLLLVGVILLDVIPLPSAGRGTSSFEKAQNKIARLGLVGAALLGFLFALTFCPVSAALFFGSLMPLAVSHKSAVLLPLLYGVGTALPVVGFSLILAFAAGKISRAYNAISVVEKWMRRITAGVFIVVGSYYCLTYLFGLI